MEEVCHEVIWAPHIPKHHLVHCLLNLLKIYGIFHHLIMFLSEHPRDVLVYFFDVLFPICLVLSHDVSEVLDQILFYLPSSLCMLPISLP